MKKIIIAFAFVLASASVLMAQHMRKVSEIKSEQVPVAVKNAFQEDFGKIPEEGTWTVAYYVSTDGNKTSAKPVSYIFAKGRRAEKIEVRYTPEGKLESAKGLEKINANT
jgi:hypothetical protein